MKLNKKQQAILMYFTVPISGFTVDIIITSLPSIKEYFTINTHIAQYVFTFCLLGFALGQILAGFIVDALERKKVLLYSMLSLIGLLIISAYTNSIHFLIGVRLLQGLVISFVAVSARAVIRDIHTDDEYKKAVNYLTIGFAMALTCSPFVGSVILKFFSYKMVFVFLALYVLIITIGVIFTEESNTKKKKITINNIKTDVGSLFKDRFFLRSMIICGCFHSVIPIFDTIGSFLVTDIYNYTVLEFGWAEILLAFFWLIGNLINRFLSNIKDKTKTVTLLFTALFIAVLGLGYVTFFNDYDVVLLGVLSIIITAIAVLFPLHIGIALIHHKDKAGLANAILFSGIWFFTAIISNIATLLNSNTSKSIYGLILLVLSIATLTYFTFNNKSKENSFKKE